MADGTSFEGKAFGALTPRKIKAGEVVFNTAMSGYQEILTDPSYRGQLVAMTYPLIGNYGVNEDDAESRELFLNGLIIKELSRVTSNWRATMSLDEYLKRHGVVGIAGIDTRALTLHIRARGALGGAIAGSNVPAATIKAQLARSHLVGVDLVQEVVLPKPYRWNNRGKYNVVVLDTGIKHNILRLLAALGCRLSVMPPTATLEQIMAERPDGVFLSNGPGDPEALDYIVTTVAQLIGRLPIFGICLGQQILARALGASTYKLKFGHHGANHPVKNLATARVEITSQNHGFSIDPTTLPKDVRVSHTNLNDGTCEGIEHTKLPVFSVQYHPEAAPGPHDSRYLFDRFISLMKSSTRVKV